jgi:hypothetical protein
MKHLLVAVYSLSLAGSLIAVRADDSTATTKSSTGTTTTEHKAPVATAEQKAAQKDLLAKYDANKDGKLDKEERKKITSEDDKAKLKKAGWATKQGRKASKKTSSDTASTK